MPDPYLTPLPPVELLVTVGLGLLLCLGAAWLYERMQK